MSKDPQTLTQALGYEFADASLLCRALTHRSACAGWKDACAGQKDTCADARGAPAEHNERMEFLGDAVLGFLAGDALYRRFPDYPEGMLTKIRSFLVSGENLATVGRRLDVGAYLLLSKDEEARGGRSKKSLIGNAVEALIAAVYLDGGIEAARGAVEALIVTEAALGEAVENLAGSAPKSALQEWAQARKLDTPEYRVLAESGPSHRRTFTVEVRVGRKCRAAAEGPSKKAAESKAAAAALKIVENGE